MHSNRMYTTCLSCRLGGGGYLARGCLPRGLGVYAQGGTHPHCMLGYTPLLPVNRMTGVKTLPCPKLRLRAVTTTFVIEPLPPNEQDSW